MLTYSVVVVEDKIYGDEEIIIETYSNEQAAKEHKKFIEDNDCYVDGNQWADVIIRNTVVADVFERENK